MRSVLYVLLTSFKNTILELRRNPGKLIAYLLVIALIVVLAFTSQVGSPTAGQPRLDLYFLKALLFAYATIFVVYGVIKGLASGDTFFDMSYVNLMFVSPISPQTVLLYGLLRMTKIAFLAGFFILFQSSTFANIFGVDFAGLLLVLLAFMMSLVMTEIVTLLIYNFANGNNRRKSIVRAITIVIFVPAIILFAVQYVQTGDLAKTLEVLMASPAVNWIPAAGWAANGAIGFLQGDLTTGLIFFGLIIVASVLLVLFMMMRKVDYYEDVLVATESEFEKKRAIAEGKVGEATVSKRKVKVSGTGLWGTGPQVLFSKHLREAFRGNRLGFISTSSGFMIAGAIVAALFMKELPNSLTILMILMWVQTFMIGTGSGMKELFSHYIYLIPAGSFSKIVWSNIETLLRITVEATVIFVVCGVIMGDNVVVIVLSILAYVLFSLLLIGINYLSLRWIRTTINSGILMTIYIIAVLLIAAPGIVGGVLVGALVGGVTGIALGLAIMCVWELFASVICIALSKGVLDTCDMPTQGMVKQ